MFGTSFLTLLPLVALASCASVPRELPRRAFDASEHLGNLSPYFPAPVPSDTEIALPGDCTVEQVMLVRIPTSSRTRLCLGGRALRRLVGSDG